MDSFESHVRLLPGKVLRSRSSIHSHLDSRLVPHDFDQNQGTERYRQQQSLSVFHQCDARGPNKSDFFDRHRPRRRGLPQSPNQTAFRRSHFGRQHRHGRKGSLRRRIIQSENGRLRKIKVKSRLQNQ